MEPCHWCSLAGMEVFLKNNFAVYWASGDSEGGTWGTEGSWQSPGSPKVRYHPSQTSCSSWLGTASLSMRRCRWSSFEYARLPAADSGTGESRRKPVERERAKFQDKEEYAWNTKQQWIIYYQHHHSPRSADFTSAAAVKNSLKPIVAHFKHPPPPIHRPSVLLPVSFSLFSSLWESFLWKN